MSKGCGRSKVSSERYFASAKNGRVNAGDGRGRPGMMDVLRQWNRH